FFYYAFAIRTLHSFPTRRSSDLVDRDVFGLSYDKGWMCIQVFFIRQGKLIERDVSIFPFFCEASEAFITFIGRFYLHENHLKPRSEEHTSELQSRFDLVCRLLLE